MLVFCFWLPFFLFFCWSFFSSLDVFFYERIGQQLCWWDRICSLLWKHKAKKVKICEYLSFYLFILLYSRGLRSMMKLSNKRLNLKVSETEIHPRKNFGQLLAERLRIHPTSWIFFYLFILYFHSFGCDFKYIFLYFTLASIPIFFFLNTERR